MAEAVAELQPSKPPLLMQRAYERLRRDIIHCELEPGRDVTEAELALRLGFGKGPVRAALARLCQDGLVTPVHRRGYQIAPITISDIHDILEMRMLLEPAATRRAVGNIDKGVLQSIARSSSAASGQRFAVDHDINRQFHVMIVRACGNQRIADTVALLIDQMERVLRIFTRKRDVEATRREYTILQGEHDEI